MRNDLQEAVEYFEIVERNNGPDAMVHFGPVARMEMLRQYKLARTALAALRDALKRAEGCDTCMKGQAMFGDVLWAFNKDGKAVININGEQANTVFPYCPMCGRKLEDEK